MKTYDPYPLHDEPKAPLDYVHDAVCEVEGDEHEESEEESFHDRPERPIRKLTEPLPDSSHGASMWKSLFDLFVSLLNGGPNDSRALRVITTLSVIALIGFTLAALGKVHILGFTGFAHASDVKEIRIDQLDDKIESAIKSQCLAPTSESKWYYYEKLKPLKRKYKDIDANYTPPTCRDLGVPDVQVRTPP